MNLLLRLPADVHSMLAELATKDRRSLNAQMIHLIEQAARAGELKKRRAKP